MTSEIVRTSLFVCRSITLTAELLSSARNRRWPGTSRASPSKSLLDGSPGNGIDCKSVTSTGCGARPTISAKSTVAKIFTGNLLTCPPASKYWLTFRRNRFSAPDPYDLLSLDLRRIEAGLPRISSPISARGLVCSVSRVVPHADGLRWLHIERPVCWRRNEDLVNKLHPVSLR